MVLYGEQVATLQGHCTTFGLSYQRLNNIAAASGDLVWPVRPKVHKMQHVPELASILNPTQVQWYIGGELHGDHTACLEEVHGREV